MNVIDVDGISKRYSLGATGIKSIITKSNSVDNDFWALKDISFSIREGEAIGIVGSNGAGKSTLLKILSRITAPTSGTARIRGRLGAILEVGTGFHPELSGRENIYLNGAILGLQRAEINARLDSIIDFASLEQFIDTPVKRYSSGMYVRLAFAVAAHLDPDILIVDEVLAVGDVGFQKKCLSRMDESMRKEGRTILFVSHNMQAIRHLCTRAVLLENGCLTLDGTVNTVLSKYSSAQKTDFNLSKLAISNRKNRASGRVLTTNFQLESPKPISPWTFSTGDRLQLRINYKTIQKIDSLSCSLTLTDMTSGVIVTNLKESVTNSPLLAGEVGSIYFEIQELTLRPGDFALSFTLGNSDFSIIDDLLDTNVGLPMITIESSEQDIYRRMGLVDMKTILTHCHQEIS